MKKLFIFIGVPLFMVILLSLLNLTDFLATSEKRVFDTLLHIKPAPPENKDICIIGIDDPAIDTAGPWPWPRDIIADGLIIMKELGARYVVFDIEYINASLRTVDPQRIDQLKTVINKEFGIINKLIEDLLTDLANQAITLNQFISIAVQESGISESEILKLVDVIARNNDEYMGRAATLFGNTYFTVNALEEADPTVTDEERQYVLANIVIKDCKEYGSYHLTTEDIKPTIMPILSRAKGAGFTKVVIDKDGVQRSIDLLVKYKDKFLPQVAFSPLLDWLGNPSIEAYSDHLVLKNAVLPMEDGGKASQDISIPFDEQGHFLINWLHTSFNDSFKHISYRAFLDYAYYEKLLIEALGNMLLVKKYGTYYKGEIYPLKGLADARELVTSILESGQDPSFMEDYKEFREQIFKEIGEFLSTADGELNKDIDRKIEKEGSQAKKLKLLENKKQVEEDFRNTRNIFDLFMETRKKIHEVIADSFALIGLTSTATTDIGVTPFDENYMNVGTHASVVNTILSRNFLDNTPWWYGTLAALALSIGIAFLLYVLKKPLMSIIAGGSIVIAIVLLLSIFFILTSIYFNLLTPSLSVFFTFIILTFLNFLATAREKTYIRNAFSHYLSNDVINELILDPSKLILGGEEKNLTAMFTDIRSFSSISEQLTPSQLVQLLNAYLTAMSDIILELRGTIDKYEGDAIICFFGAPIPFADHARRCCLAAIKMKKMEQELNERLLKESLSPSTLHTRIGINSGNMVVGNMGTTKKFDYTIMGHSVNLASRLEGVNKLYGTWSIISENTFKECGDDFALRKLDRVRVINIKEPVRLYELIDEKSALSSSIKESFAIFHSALELFEKRDWEKALKQFKEVQKLIPGDGPAEFFIKRCLQYKRKPPEDSWDGVFNLTTK
jgi:adenylate cyclase